MAFKKGTLYVITVDKSLQFDGIEDNLDSPEDDGRQRASSRCRHRRTTTGSSAGIGPDDKLYTAIGSPCNVCEINTGMHGLIRRQNLDGSNIEVVARGVRNSVGFDWHPQTKELWFTDNGPDWISNDGPEEELNRVAKGNEGAHFGFPYCHANGVADPSVKRPNPCAGVTLAGGDARTPRRCARHALLLGQHVPGEPTRTLPSSPGAAPGTASRSSAMTSCRPRSTAARRPSRPS